MPRYAVLRLDKTKRLIDLGRLSKHLERTRDTPNADPTRLHLNERLAGTGDVRADVQARLSVAPKIRANAVLAIEHVLTASKEFFDEGTPQEQRLRREAWSDATMDWLRTTYGADNVVAAVLHRDELTSHIQAVVVPIDEHGRLNARHFIGGTRYRLAELQDSYAAAMKPLGLERGVRGSVLNYEPVRKFYGRLKQPPREAVQELLNALTIDPPPRVVPKPREYAEEARKQVVRAITPYAEGMAQRIDYLSHRVNNLERQIREQAAQLEKERARTAHERPVSLDAVLEALGGRSAHARDGERAWKLGGETVTLNGETFHNRDHGGRGTGPIGLVEYHTGYTFREAVAWIRHALGPEEALRAGARHLRQIIEHEPQPAFRAAEPDPRQWAGVRAHLIDERALEPEHIDALSVTGALYADKLGHAVFLHRDERGMATGASLWSTRDGGKDLGLAAGTQRDATFFEITEGTAGALHRAQLVIADSPVDALAWLALHRDEHGTRHAPVRVIALDETETLPQAAIAETFRRGGVVRVATANDPRGERIWQRLRQQHHADQYRAESIIRDRPKRENWSAVRRDRQRGRPDRAPTQGRARTSLPRRPPPHWDRVRGEDYGHEIG